MLQGHLERMLTGNATDIGAMLAGVREHHDTLVSALEGEPAAAASLADSGVLNALQVSIQGGHTCSTLPDLLDQNARYTLGFACPRLSLCEAAGL